MMADMHTPRTGDIAPDPPAWHGVYQPRHAPWGAVKRWVEGTTATRTGTCPHCTTEHTVRVQYLAAATASLVRTADPHHSFGMPGDARDAELDWARVCACATTAEPAEPAPATNHTEEDP